MTVNTCVPLRWRHNDHDSVSNHQPHDCLLNRLFRRRSKKTSKLRVTGLCVGNSPGTKGQLRGKCFHLMTSSCLNNISCLLTVSTDLFVCFQFITILLLLSLFCCVMYDLYSCLHMHMFFKYFITLVYSYFWSISTQNVLCMSCIHICAYTCS